MTENKKPKESPSFIRAKEMVPPELHPIFEQLVKEYQFAAFKTHGHAMVSPRVIAELVLMGWRSYEDPRPRDKNDRESE